MTNIKIKTIDLETNKKIKDTTIVSFSDTHLIDEYSLILFKKIINEIKILKPNYICFNGDLVDDTKKIIGTIDNKIIELLKELSTIAPVIFVKGNHDVAAYQKINDTISHNFINGSFFRELKEIKNLYYLKNEYKTFNNINFVRIEETYENYCLEKENDKNFIKQTNKNIKFINKENNYNIILCHSPLNIMKKELINKINILKNIINKKSFTMIIKKI